VLPDARAGTRWNSAEFRFGACDRYSNG